MDNEDDNNDSGDYDNDGVDVCKVSLHSKIFSVHQQCETNEILYLKKYRIFLKKKGFEDLLPRQNIDWRRKTLPMRHLTDRRNL